jgi:hypothetical protein
VEENEGIAEFETAKKNNTITKIKSQYREACVDCANVVSLRYVINHDVQ